MLLELPIDLVHRGALRSRRAPMLRRIGQGCQEVAVPKRDVGVPVLEDPIGPSLELNDLFVCQLRPSFQRLGPFERCGTQVHPHAF
ncbi:MAG: hypothetical protein DMF90_29595, partial [Acidobacteria bacterium]